MTEQKYKHLCALLPSLVVSLVVSLLGAACGDPPVRPRTADLLNKTRVITQHNDAGRTGAYLEETVLNVGSVSGGRFGKLFSRAVDGQLYAQPLYLPGISIPSQGIHNVVYLATQHNSVFAYDADHAAQESPLWQVYLGPPVPSVAIDATCNSIVPEIGITSTPVIDPTTNTLYVAALTKDEDGPRYWLHALDAATGLPRQHSPVPVKATVRGDGAGSSSGQVSLDARHHLNRPGLLLSGGVVYLAFASDCDIDPYHGWVLGYDAATLAQRYVYNTSPHGERGGIWQSGNGLSADADGNIYALVGNGSFDMDHGGPDLGESIIKLTPGPDGLVLSDWFTPHDEKDLEDNDWDMSTGAVLLSDNNLLVGGDKAGSLYVLDRHNLGHYHPGDDSQILQRLPASTGGIYNSPVYWQGPHGGLLYMWADQDRMKVYTVTPGGVSAAPVAMADEGAAGGAPMSLSANGSAAGSGVLWAIHRDAQANDNGILRAYDALDVTNELWTSQDNAERDEVGTFVKFCPPTVVNGRVYVPTGGGVLQVYGLRN